MEQKTSYFLKLSPEEQKAAIEALIFSSDEPVTVDTLYRILIASELSMPESDSISDIDKLSDNPAGQMTIEKEIKDKLNITPEYFQGLIDEINLELIETNRPYQITVIAGGYQYATRPEYGELIQYLVKSRAKKRLSQAALETLAIIAYRQPVTKPEIEKIRGVNSIDVINALIDKNLVKIVGRKDALGKPLLYATTQDFLRVFGLQSIDDLPKIREFEEITSREAVQYKLIETEPAMETSLPSTNFDVNNIIDLTQSNKQL